MRKLVLGLSSHEEDSQTKPWRGAYDCIAGLARRFGKCGQERGIGDPRSRCMKFWHGYRYAWVEIDSMCIYGQLDVLIPSQ
jgi:hypothetical protein